MPYMQYLFCERCGVGFNLDIDYHATLEAYARDGRKGATVSPPTLIWDYLVYSCEGCKTKYKYTYAEVEGRVREHFSSLSKQYKVYFDELAEYNSTEKSRSSGAFFVERDPSLRDRIRKLYGSKG